MLFVKQKLFLNLMEFRNREQQLISITLRNSHDRDSTRDAVYDIVIGDKTAYNWTQWFITQFEYIDKQQIGPKKHEEFEFLDLTERLSKDVQETCYLLMPADYREMQEAKLVSKYASAKEGVRIPYEFPMRRVWDNEHQKHKEDLEVYSWYEGNAKRFSNGDMYLAYPFLRLTLHEVRVAKQHWQNAKVNLLYVSCVYCPKFLALEIRIKRARLPSQMHT